MKQMVATIWKRELRGLVLALGLLVSAPILALAGQSAMLLLGVGASATGAVPIITSATTYYVCAKANGGTCVYNGDGGTVAATIADANDCTTKSTPCRTIDGVRAKIAGNFIAAVVTIQLADTAGTSTDCYRPNNTVFQNTTLGAGIDTSLSVANGGASTGTYPASYLYLLGNTTTVANVKMTGATTCSGTTANDVDGVKFAGNLVTRVRGIQAQYFKQGAGGPDNGAFEFYSNPSVFAEDLNYVGDTTTVGQLLTCWNCTIRLGSSLQWSVTSGNVLDIVNNSHGSFISPLGRANIAVTTGAWTAGFAMFLSNEFSHMGVDGLSLTVTGNATGAAAVWGAIANSSITWNDDSTFTAPAQTHSINGANITYLKALQGGYINDICRTISQLTCTIGNTTTILRMADADIWSYIGYIQNPTATANTDTVTDGSFIKAPARQQFGFTATTFANLDGAQANGAITYCSDCTFANPCAGSGTGAFAKRLNGAWRCD